MEEWNIQGGGNLGAGMMNEGMLIRFVNIARNILFTALGKFQRNYYEIKLVSSNLHGFH